MRICIFLLWTFVGQVDKQPSIPFRDFAKLVNLGQSKVQDLTFSYEGKLEFTNSASANSGEFFQGTYSFRSDGATRLEVMARITVDPALESHSEGVLLHGKFVSNEGKTSENVSSARQFFDGGLLHAPRELVRHHHLQTIQLREHANYEYLGVEEIDGRKCLKAKLDFGLTPDSEKSQTYSICWFDMERDANIVRVESFTNGKPWTKATNTRLAQFRGKNQEEIWLPVHVELSFYNKRENNVPMSIKVIDVILGTVLVNQGLADSAFALKTKPRVKNFSDTTPFDMKSIQNQLDKQLVEAQKQSKALEASSATRIAWDTASLIRWSLVILGVVLISLGLWQRFRNR